MCQSKEEGGRRCAGRNPLASNYPSFVAVDEKASLVVLKSESFASRPDLALHAAVMSARSGYPLSQDAVEAGRKVADEFHKIPKQRIWEQWNDLVLAEQPSLGLQAIHEMGWEKNFPELAAIRGVPQSPIWHPEGSVEIHSQQAADVAARRAREEGLNDSETRVAVMGAICHDFGKAVSTKIEDDGRISSSGHDDEGEPIARSFLERIGASKDVRMQVPALVKEHMCHTNKPSYKAVRKLSARLEAVGSSLEAWGRIAEADRGGRGSASTSGISKEWLDVKATVDQYKEKQFSNLVSGALLREIGHEDTSTYKEIILESRKAQFAGEINTQEEAIQWMKDKKYI
jgi:tRNA nucleotidyltransferase (CCA-adding enzyme)